MKNVKINKFDSAASAAKMKRTETAPKKVFSRLVRPARMKSNVHKASLKNKLK